MIDIDGIPRFLAAVGVGTLIFLCGVQAGQNAAVEHATADLDRATAELLRCVEDMEVRTTLMQAHVRQDLEAVTYFTSEGR